MIIAFYIEDRFFLLWPQRRTTFNRDILNNRKFYWGIFCLYVKAIMYFRFIPHNVGCIDGQKVFNMCPHCVHWMILTIYMMSLHRTLLHFTYPSRQILLISIVTVKSMKMGQIKVRKGEQQPFKTNLCWHNTDSRSQLCVINWLMNISLWFLNRPNRCLFKIDVFQTIPNLLN